MQHIIASRKLVSQRSVVAVNARLSTIGASGDVVIVLQEGKL